MCLAGRLHNSRQLPSPHGEVHLQVGDVGRADAVDHHCRERLPTRLLSDQPSGHLIVWPQVGSVTWLMKVNKQASVTWPKKVNKQGSVIWLMKVNKQGSVIWLMKVNKQGNVIWLMKVNREVSPG